MADHRPDVYFSEPRGKWIFRASSLSRCIQSLTAAGLGHERMPPPDFMQRAWDEGSHGEAKVLDLFRNGSNGWHPESPILTTAKEANTTVTGLRFKSLPPNDPASYHYNGVSFPHVRHDMLQSDQIDAEVDPQFVMEIPVGDKALIRGHLDDIVECYQGPIGTGAEWIGRRYVNEAKLFGVDYFKAWMRKGMADPKFNGYAWQLSLYMHGTGLPGWFTVGEKVRWKEGDSRLDEMGLTVPESQRYDLERVHVTYFPTPPIPLSTIKVRVLKVMALLEKGELPDCDMVQYPCDYYHLCSGQKELVAAKDDGKPEPVVVEGEVAEKLKLYVENWTLATARAKSVKAEVDAAKKKVDEVLVELGKDNDKPGRWDLGDRIVEWQVTERKAETKPRAGGWTRTLKVAMKEAEDEE